MLNRYMQHTRSCQHCLAALKALDVAIPACTAVGFVAAVTVVASLVRVDIRIKNTVKHAKNEAKGELEAAIFWCVSMCVQVCACMHFCVIEWQ